MLSCFFLFIQVGLFSVGGGYAAIPLIQEQIVNTHQLLTMGEFTDLITIAEMTLGPISINSATFVGTRLAGGFEPSFVHWGVLSHPLLSAWPLHTFITNTAVSAVFKQYLAH